MSFDFSAPFVAARIILPSGALFPLWTNVGDRADAVRPAGSSTTGDAIGTQNISALAYVQEVQVILNLSGMPQLSVQLAPPFEDGMRFLDSSLADGRMRNVLEVQLGYAGGTSDGRAVLSPVYRASLTFPEVSIDTEVQISLKGQGLGGARESAQQVVGRPNEKLRDVATRIAAGPGGARGTFDVDFSRVEAAGPGSVAYRAFDAPAADFAQGGRSDWLALWEIAQRASCDLVVESPENGGTTSRLVFVPRREGSAAPPVRRYRLYHYPAGRFQGVTMLDRPGDEDAEFPILAFSCNTEAVWNALTAQDVLNNGARMDDVNEDTAQPETTAVTLEGEAEPVGGGEGAQTLEGSNALPVSGDEGRLPLPGDGNNPSARRTVQNEVAANSDMGMQCELEILGDPTILPGDMISVAGLGRRFDNRLYRVYTVTHSIGLGGFATNLVVNSNIDARTPSQEEAPSAEAAGGTGRTPTGQPNTADVMSEERWVASLPEFVTDPNI